MTRKKNLSIPRRAENVKTSIKGREGCDCGLSESTTAEEGGQSDCPHSCMERVGEIDGLTQCRQMLDGDGGTESPLVARALFVRRGSSHLDPTVVAKPGGVIGKMPRANS